MSEPLQNDGGFKVTEKKLNLSRMAGALDSELLIPSLVFPDEFPFDLDSPESFRSPLTSGVVSAEDSTEEDNSDEDESEFLAGLNRRLTQKLAVPSRVPQNKADKTCMATSPQSTLSGLGSWSVSSNGSPNGPSQAPSPPTTPLNPQNDTWDLISAAAGEIARLEMSSEPQMFVNDAVHSTKNLPYSQNETFLKNSSLFNTSQPAYFSLRQSSQFQQQLRREQFLNSGYESVWATPARQSPTPPVQSKGSNFNYGFEVGGCRRPVVPHASWSVPRVQSLNHPPQPAMRAMLLGGSGGGVKRKCAGTGVFLPRRCGNPPEPRKKSGCSTVLLPPKVVQALNLNLDDLSNRSHPQLNLAASYEAIMARRNGLSHQQRRDYRSEGLRSHGLPQDWTY